MGKWSKIEWCDHTFNPWIGCVEITAGCAHCYARRLMERWGKAKWGKDEPRIRTSEKNWYKPRVWNMEAEAKGIRYKVFCASLSDVFEIQDPILDEWRLDLFMLINQTPHLDWLILTKRPDHIPAYWQTGMPTNVWLGVTVENQEMLEERIWFLYEINATVRWLSLEPLLGPIDFLADPDREIWPWLEVDHVRESFDWAIVGGETGAGAREMNPDWARSIRVQCRELGIPFFMKQMTNKAPIPEDLMIREFPEPQKVGTYSGWSR